jgi:tRNA (guanine-N7-)-methyltransferase
VGKNKLAKFVEIKHFENVFQPTFEELQQNGFRFKGKWASLYFGNNSPLIVEMGCGKGEYTVKMAGKFPEKNFIGLDIKGARMFTGAKKALGDGLKNVAFIRTKIENCEWLFGPGEIAEIWLTFPDPQMKKVKKRLTSTFFLRRYQKFLSREGIIHLKTDSAFLYNYTLTLASLNQFKILGHTDNLYASELLNDVSGILTFYEKQWLDKNIPIKYLAFVPEEKESLSEPVEDFEKDSYRSFGRSARN